VDGAKWFLGDIMKIYLDHIGIACNDLESSSGFWRLIGLVEGDKDETVTNQGVITRFFSTTSNDKKQPRIELLEPTGENTPIGKFLKNRGPGVQQICFRVDDLEKMIQYLTANEIQMIDQEPRIGAHGNRIAFVHPKSTGGVLVELTQY
jgi:methylmalonyl-CoA/ethylmalonyl-CoA epimerase